MRQHSYRQPPFRRAQGGVAAITAAIAMVAMLAAVALAIDVGRLYAGQRSLQRAADLAALDAVRTVSGCNGSGQRGTLLDAQTEAAASLLRNGVQNTTLQIETGARNTQDLLSGFTPLPDGDPRVSAVRVTLRQAAPGRIIPGLTPSGSGTLIASAAAQQAAQATVIVGSSVLTLDSANSPLLNSLLGGLLGGNVNLSVASQRGLAAAQASLGGLMAAAGVSTPQGLMEVRTTLPGALRLVADALNETGGSANAAAAATLAGLIPIVDPSRSVLLGDVLQLPAAVSPEGEQLPLIDALSLVTALAESASVGKPLDLPLSVTLPAGLANTKLALTITQGPSTQTGPAGLAPDGTPLTVARSAALRLQLRADVLDVSGALGGLSPLIGVVAQPIKLGIDIELGAAEASVQRIECPTLAKPGTRVTLNLDSQLASVRAGTFSGSPQALPPLGAGALLSAINLPLIGPVLAVNLKAPVALDVGVPRSSTALFDSDFPLYVPLPTSTNPRQMGDEALLGSAGYALAGVLAQQLSVKLLGAELPLADVSALTTTLLAPVLGLLDQVIDPLLGQLGIQPGAATVTLTQVQVPQATLFNIETP